MKKPAQASKPQPPRLADKLLEWFCAPHLLEELQGDLHEEFYYQLERVGEKRARLRYVWDVLGFIRPFAMKCTSSTYSSSPLLHVSMFQSYLTIALRTLWRSKGYTSLNIAGLSVAFCICTFLFLTVHFQLSFDSFHQGKDRIFQTYFFKNEPEGANWSDNMPMPLTPALKASYPEVQGATRVLYSGHSSISYKGKRVDKNVVLTDPDFLRLFSFPMLKGHPENALRDLSSIIISEKLAGVIFGKEDPIGKVLQLGSEGKQKGYMVSGVIADPPENSTLRYDAVIRIENAGNYLSTQNQWDAFFMQTYIKLAPGVDKAAFENKLKPFADQYLAEEFSRLKNKGARPDKAGDLFAIRLVNLSDVHFGPTGNKASLYQLVCLAFVILLIACFNFTNLSMARCFTRAREVGVRKTLGARKGQLFVQIWGEAILLCLAGFIAGLLLTYVLTPGFNTFFGAHLTLQYMWQPGVILLLLTLFVGVALIAGGYPALFMSKFNPVEVLKGKVSLKRPGILRNSLIVMQFAMSALLACCTVIALQQEQYLRSMPTGFEKEQVISIPVGNKADGRQVLARLRNRLAGDPTVISITGSDVNLGYGKDGVSSRSAFSFTYNGREVSTDWLLVDYNYLKTLSIPLLAGREFNPAIPTDSVNRVIITQSMADMLGEGEPVGKIIRDDNNPEAKGNEVIGVIADFHLYGATSKLHPITMHMSHHEPINYIFVRITPQSLQGAISRLQGAWKQAAPGTEFLGSFVDENVDAMYEDQKRFSHLLTLASGIAVLLSCAGLFAIALLVIEQRTKEIGIRKVLGANVSSIILVLSKEFVKLVLISLSIAIPVAWWLMQEWLANFPYQIAISGWVFAGVGAAALLVALLTISVHSIKAALANPVKALRQE
ncbi:permease prefix domain 2-containing transporter [Rhodocytophaga aerolata]|uniref:Permease prefix domain 2-containing transporter n=1 Tax=Rhodocytophaga aerolata TaxID=455078 RepID=A0ABT8RHK6_9BACT|nr:ABC transporter permease [Rhodocytophaga aerolata]MDO1450864.1 permease prefix domain 2-containing transporter [Rhodocytophaga aerolata]